jgi:NADPH:quinone reductase-like Zn-dependent oxidoreductase
MKKTTLGTSIAILTLAAGTAFAAVSEADIIANLTAQGYSDITVEVEDDGTFEAEAMKDGAEWEIIIDPTTGEELSAELETDDDDDHDDEGEDEADGETASKDDGA